MKYFYKTLSIFCLLFLASFCFSACKSTQEISQILPNNEQTDVTNQQQDKYTISFYLDIFYSDQNPYETVLLNKEDFESYELPNPELEQYHVFTGWFLLGNSNDRITSLTDVNLNNLESKEIKLYGLPVPMYSISENGNLSRNYDYYDDIFDDIVILRIPAELNGITVKHITGMKYTNLKEVYIPSSVETIGEHAFSNLKNLERVVFEENSSIKTIDNYAFYNSQKLNYINLPEGLEKIGSSALSACDLRSITIPSTLTSISDSFSMNSNLSEIYYNAINCSTDHNPFGCTEFGTQKLTLTIGSKVTKIPEEMFAVSGITDFVFEENSVCTEIGDLAFAQCPKLETVNIPESITKIGKGAFAVCPNIKTINFNAVLCADFKSDDHVFRQVDNQASFVLNIGNKVTNIPAYMFYHTSLSEHKLTSIVFEENSVCTTIGKYAFYRCENLLEIDLPVSVTTISDYAFSGSSLTRIVIPKNVLFIGYGAFLGLRIEEIYYNAENAAGYSYDSNLIMPFEGCGYNVNTVLYIGKDVWSIPNCMFRGSYINSIIFDKNSDCEIVGDYAFMNSPIDTIFMTNSVRYLRTYCLFNTNIASSTLRIYFYGSKNEFENIDDDSSSGATVYFYSSEIPEENLNKYWHFDEDGKTPIPWQKAVREVWHFSGNIYLGEYSEEDILNYNENLIRNHFNKYSVVFIKFNSTCLEVYDGNNYYFRVTSQVGENINIQYVENNDTNIYKYIDGKLYIPYDVLTNDGETSITIYGIFD